MPRDSRDVPFSRLDLPARNARCARALAWIGFVLILLSIGCFVMVWLIGFVIRDRGTPDSVVEFLALSDEVAASLKQGLAVAIHCRAGIGRSGLLAACTLLELGVAASNAFAVVSRARGLTVPDTPEQIDWFHSMIARAQAPSP